VASVFFRPKAGCGGLYLLQEGVTSAPDLCDVCDFFARRELSTVS
jgi:hypothetical protein